jgi:hypothetical protein
MATICAERVGRCKVRPDQLGMLRSHLSSSASTCPGILSLFNPDAESKVPVVVELDWS